MTEATNADRGPTPTLRWHVALCRSASRSPSVWLLVGVWALFALLVGCKVHGASLAILPQMSHQTVAPGRSPTFVFESLRAPPSQAQDDASVDSVSTLLGLRPRSIRSDEWGVSSLWALSQFAHQPRFPVVNNNLGVGQIMLTGAYTPILHVTALARPVTWGYLLLGEERGFAFAWWFPFFACFTTLYLLLDVLLGRGRDRVLSAFGALWFVGSAGVTGWSGWPAYSVFFGSLICLCLYHLITTDQRRRACIATALLGLALPGLAMCAYPAWLVPLFWLFLLILAALLWRDRGPRPDSAAHFGDAGDVGDPGDGKTLACRLAQTWRWRVGLLALSLVLAGGLLAAYLSAAGPALRALLGTVYPGSRFHAGGGYLFGWLLRGFYNYGSSLLWPGSFDNASEAGSFFPFFPPLFVAWLLRKDLRSRFGSVGAVLVALLLFLLVYMFVGLPPIVARITGMGRCHPPRADLVLGLASILLSCLALHHLSRAPGAGLGRAWALGLSLAFAALVRGNAEHVRHAVPHLPTWSLVAAVAFAGCLTYALLRGRRGIFMAGVALALVPNSLLFNPLSVGTDFVHRIELVQTVRRLNQESLAHAATPNVSPPPLWLCYGDLPLPSVCGSLITIAGARSLTGVYQSPQLPLWQTLDPLGAQKNAYNRYAHVDLRLPSEPDDIRFWGDGDRFGIPGQRTPDVLSVFVAPDHPRLRGLGTRFVVALGSLQDDPAFARFLRRYQSPSGSFSIFEIPTQTSPPR